MLTLAGCQARRQRLWALVPSDVEWLLITDPRHVQYLANFSVTMLSFSGGERGWLLLERSGTATLIGDNFAVRCCPSTPYVDKEVIEKWYDHAHSVVNRDHALLTALRTAVQSLSGPGLVEAEWLPLAATEALAGKQVRWSLMADVEPGKCTDLGSTIRQTRRVKEADELDLIKLCIKAGEAGHNRLREILIPGMTELAAFAEVHHAAVMAAGRACYIYGDFRAATPKLHKAGGLPTLHELEEGDLYILDFSVVIDGYRGDFTNTLAVGEPSTEARDMFALCQSGMQCGEQALQAGAKAADVHAAVFGPFAELGRGDLFTHHAGHGIGLAHPEAPILVPHSTDILVAGDVLTLEPGAYAAGVGGMRIEHNYLITESGYERLTNHVISLECDV